MFDGGKQCKGHEEIINSLKVSPRGSAPYSSFPFSRPDPKILSYSKVTEVGIGVSHRSFPQWKRVTAELISSCQNLEEKPVWLVEEGTE